MLLAIFHCPRYYYISTISPFCTIQIPIEHTLLFSKLAVSKSIATKFFISSYFIHHGDMLNSGFNKHLTFRLKS